MNYKFKEILFRCNNHYEKNTNITDSYLRALAELVTDGALTPKRLKERLLDTNTQQSAGNYIQIIHEGPVVLVGSQFDDDDELDKIKIPKAKLVKFIDDWLEISKDKPSSITLWRDDQYTIWLEASGRVTNHE